VFSTRVYFASESFPLFLLFLFCPYSRVSGFSTVHAPVVLTEPSCPTSSSSISDVPGDDVCRCIIIAVVGDDDAGFGATGGGGGLGLDAVAEAGPLFDLGIGRTGAGGGGGGGFRLNVGFWPVAGRDFRTGLG
jgi:hypothetical protein